MASECSSARRTCFLIFCCRLCPSDHSQGLGLNTNCRNCESIMVGGAPAANTKTQQYSKVKESRILIEDDREYSVKMLGKVRKNQNKLFSCLKECSCKCRTLLNYKGKQNIFCSWKDICQFKCFEEKVRLGGVVTTLEFCSCSEILGSTDGGAMTLGAFNSARPRHNSTQKRLLRRK